MKAAGLTLHSLRKNLATALHGLGIPESVASDILGHEHGSLSYRRHSEGPRPRTLYETWSCPGLVALPHFAWKGRSKVR